VILRRLPLAAKTGLFTAGCVLGCGLVTVVAFLVTGTASTGSLLSLGVGVGVGVVLCSVPVVSAARHASSLRQLRVAAVLRLQDPARQVECDAGPGPGSAELAELARVLEAMHVRLRVGERVGEQHRRDAETAGAGVLELLAGLVAAEEGARGQLAAELHDTVAQSLMLARGVLQAAVTTPDDLIRVSDYVQDAEEQVRAVMARTRPPALHDGDLAAAVDLLRLDMQARYGLIVAVSWPQEAHPIPLASAVTIYRFFQEGLLNVVKHADVDDVRVSLTIDEQAVRAYVEDDGPGFDPASVRPDHGRQVGLGLLTERARLSAGSLTVTSHEGSGTVLSLVLPKTTLSPPPLVVPGSFNPAEFFESATD